MAHSNISIFVPHIGCPHMCAFCNQRTITGTEEIPRGGDVKRVCAKALQEIKKPAEAEIAFFGGSFTAVPREYMLELLESAQDFIGDGKFKGIRISTRPDYIDDEVLKILKTYGVTSIELGAQSMVDRVLEANERGHTVLDVANAVKLIKSYGCFELGLQMMVGLYKSTPDDEKTTWNRIAELSPDTVRIYPVVILEDTKLGDLFKSGEYKPVDFETVVDLCTDFLTDAEKRNINVIKLGLHASEVVESQMLGGFYHPSFRELCEGRRYRREFEKEIGKHGSNIKYAEFLVPERNISKAYGQKKRNAEYFRNLGIRLKISSDKNLTERYITVNIR